MESLGIELIEGHCKSVEEVISLIQTVVALVTKHRRAESNWLKTPILRWGKRDDRENLLGKYPAYKTDVTPQGKGRVITADPIA
jgi:hypothetical protein